ncbi:MAG: hypothetical protein QOD84_2256 [Acidobacteriaceae bacterium]|jgi:hypothetical protein
MPKMGSRIKRASVVRTLPPAKGFLSGHTFRRAELRFQIAPLGAEGVLDKSLTLFAHSAQASGLLGFGRHS